MWEPDENQLVEHFWNTGDLRCFLTEHQRSMAEFALENDAECVVFNVGRRTGKSTTMANIASRIGQTVKYGVMRYGAPTAKQVKTILAPLMRKLHETCPDRLKPRYYAHEGIWVWPHTKAELHASGCDGENAERLRGPHADFGFVDEARDVANLKYVVRSILMPQMLTTKGKVIVASTPPKSPAHEFVSMALEAQIIGAYLHAPTTVASHISKERLAKFCRESGGEHSIEWRREYLAQFIVDANQAVVPEFFDYKDSIVCEFDRPEYFTPIVAADFGYNDLTFVIFGYWNFRDGKLDVEYEAVFQRANSRTITERCKEIEEQAWGRPAKIRWADATLQILADLNTLHGYSVVAPSKHDKDAALNALRNAFATGRVRIHPRCKNLISHLESGIWNNSRTDFARSGEFGHFDGIDAMIYLWRHADQRKNPAPKYPVGVTEETHFIPKKKSQGPTLVPPWRMSK